MAINLHGEGNYALTAIKSIRVTEDFTGLGERTTKCQTGEFRADCLTRNYRAKVVETCQCVPFTLRSHFTEKVGSDDEKIFLISGNVQSDENLQL